MSKIMETVKEIVQAAAAVFDPPPESFTVVDEYGNEWTYVKERTCQNLIDKADYTAIDDFQCSECYALMRQNGNAPGGVFNYCPSCGAKVVNDEG